MSLSGTDEEHGAAPGYLEGRTILLISPNEWGKMHVSKHHYALELARNGNRVFFLNPPGNERRGHVQVRPHPEIERLFLVSYRPAVPLTIRFRFRWLYDLLIRRDIAGICRAIGEPIDLVWCFESNLFSDLRQFGAPTVLYHPVDQVLYRYQIDVARSADLILSVADEIVERFAGVDTVSRFLGHGLAECFTRLAECRAELQEYTPGPRLRAGYIGNLWIGQLDRPAFRSVIERSPDVEFHIWGPLSPKDSNVSGRVFPEASELLEFLRKSDNVVLEGVAEPRELARALADLDLFLLCYDVESDPNGGANSHKILEYLSTGRVVVSNPVTSYHVHPGLLRMAASGGKNADLPDLFRDTVENIRVHNAPEEQRARARFALDHSYRANVRRIASMLAELNVCP